LHAHVDVEVPPAITSPYRTAIETPACNPPPIRLRGVVESFKKPAVAPPGDVVQTSAYSARSQWWR
jgi:hypothetical protein